MGKQAVEALVPVSVSAKAGRNAVRDHLEETADSVAGAKDLIHFGLHALFSFGIFAVQQDFIALRKFDQLLPFTFAAAARISDLDNVAQHAYAELAQE